MAKRGVKYAKDYITYWNEKGEYGRNRVDRMQMRKKKRYDKHKNKVRNGLKRINGKLYQLCDYQPGYGDSWCEYPCNGDC